MSNCCTSTNSPDSAKSKRHACPKNKKNYAEVPFTTVLHHVRNAWDFTTNEDQYYFCSDPDCDVVYFSLHDKMVNKNALRTKVAIKETSADSLICYCFGKSRQRAANDKTIRDFVVEQTRNGRCACATHNPSGRCCLKDFST